MIEVGDIVQIDPSIDKFGGCLAVVNEVKTNQRRIMAYVKNAGQDGAAYIYLDEDKYESTGGKALWVVK